MKVSNAHLKTCVSEELTPQVQEPGAQPQFVQVQEELPQPPIVLAGVWFDLMELELLVVFAT